MTERFLLSLCFAVTFAYINLRGYISNDKFAHSEINFLLNNLFAAIFMLTVMVVIFLSLNPARKENNLFVSGCLLIFAQIFLGIIVLIDEVVFVANIIYYLAIGLSAFATLFLLNEFFYNGQGLSEMTFKEQIAIYNQRNDGKSDEVAERAFYFLLALLLVDFIVYRHPFIRDFMTVETSLPEDPTRWPSSLFACLQIAVLTYFFYMVTKGLKATKRLEYIVAGFCGILWGSKIFEYEYYELGSLAQQRFHVLWLASFLFTLLLSFFAVKRVPT